MKRLRVCIDARQIGHEGGSGVAQFVLALARGLGALEQDEQEFLFLTYLGCNHYLEPLLGRHSRILSVSSGPPADAPLKARMKRWLRPFRAVYDNYGYRLSPGRFRLADSDGTIERADSRVVHFTGQSGFRTKVPSIYHPHDLQHLHLPQFFTPKIRAYREFTYRANCDQARYVAVASEWVKNDLISHYALSPQKIAVVPLAPTFEADLPPTEAELEATRVRYSLPAQFALYPAQTWPHKNHMALIEAAAMIRDRNSLQIPIVCSGNRTEFYEVIQSQIQRLGMEEAVHFVGFVSRLELQCLYRLATCVIIPTRFEAGSFPVWEAFLSGCPVACSNVTSLPDQAGDAALLFDPESPPAIADALFPVVDLA